MEIIIGISLFIAILLILMSIFFLLRRKLNTETQRVHSQLRSISMNVKANKNIDIMKKRRNLSNIPWLNSLLLNIPFLRKIDQVLLQSQVKSPLGVFLLFAFVLGFTGFLIPVYLSKNPLIGIVAAGALGSLPFFYISMRKNIRVRKFERQLPEALDMVARALKAGHAFTGGLQMVVEEFDDPIRSEIATVVDEINFGIGIKESLMNLAERIDGQDIRFFVVAVTIQKETGGDLAEILGNIARLIRERFKLYDRIRTLTAEGKMSAIILLALPFGIALVISFVNPKHMQVLINSSIGNILIGISLGMMIIGVFAMKKIIAIKV